MGMPLLTIRLGLAEVSKIIVELAANAVPVKLLGLNNCTHSVGAQAQNALGWAQNQ